MTALEALKQYFGYSGFRSGQEELIRGILAGRDVLGIMPTGAGKSVCFQIPALLSSGVALVVSPLISLMKDQVNALTQSGVAAAFINSSLTPRQVDKALQNARNGAYKLIYVAPERLPTSEFMAFVRSVRISMLTVDEAHCISQWGQDFRPSYARIPEFIAELPERPPVSAFTATATPRVRGDIVSLLQLSDPQILVTGFDRQNLYFDVLRPKNKYAALAKFLSGRRESCGIVYCATRKTVEEVCEQLRKDGYEASRYHAGLNDRERRENQDDFLYDRVRIMVATNAFGMGIDKSNVSFVVHYNMPKDIESYYQEAGRAGRDGGPADCLLLYSGQDVRINQWMIENEKEAQYPDKETERQLKERGLRRLRDMTFYSTTPGCMRRSILRYFGETPPNRCGNCGGCVSKDAAEIPGAGAPNDVKAPMDRLPRNLFGDDDISDNRGARREREPRQRRDRSADKRASAVSVNKELFALLRELRLEIAKEQGVPAFVVFSDSTLVDMCARVPRTREEFLDVSGVGEVKLERHGDKFLAAINKYLGNDGINGAGDKGSSSAPSAPLVSFVPSEQAKSPKISVSSGTSAAYDAAMIEITDDPVTVSVIADRINCLFIQLGRKKLTGQKINEWLIAGGYVEAVAEEGKNRKAPTAKGAALGIKCEERVIRGENMKLNLYGREAQELVVRNALNITVAPNSRKLL